MAKLNDETIYRCVSGFVPGLPAECSLKQARELGLETDFLAAVENGTYVTLTPGPSPKGQWETESKET